MEEGGRYRRSRMEAAGCKAIKMSDGQPRQQRAHGDECAD